MKSFRLRFLQQRLSLIRFVPKVLKKCRRPVRVAGLGETHDCSICDAASRQATARLSKTFRVLTETNASVDSRHGVILALWSRLAPRNISRCVLRFVRHSPVLSRLDSESVELTNQAALGIDRSIVVRSRWLGSQRSQRFNVFKYPISQPVPLSEWFSEKRSQALKVHCF